MENVLQRSACHRTDPFSPKMLTYSCCVLLLSLTGLANSAERTVSQSRPSTSTQPPGGDSGGGGSVGELAARGRNLRNILPEGGSNTSDANIIPDIDSYSKAQLYALLVEVLEKLNVLAPKAPSCYQLQKIVHEVIPRDSSDQSKQPDPDGPFRSVGVYLYFKESPLTSLGDDGGGVSGDGGNVTRAGKAPPSGESKVTPGAKSSNECVSEPDVEMSMDAQPLVRDTTLPNNTHQHQQTSSGKVNGSGAGPQMGSNGEFQMNGEDEDNNNDTFGGLSKTQVVVISTCSAIIGLFFIVAFVLRVRNYIKRVREEQQQASRPTFRSCSVRLRSASHSTEQVRRDSQGNVTSRAGAAGYSMTNGSTSRDHSNASSPHHDPDTKPLLLVTAVTEVQSLHSPSGSQSSSLQFIDEEPRRKTERATTRAVNGDDSEARPLLASSEVSANSLALSPSSPLSDTLPQNGGPHVNSLPQNGGLHLNRSSLVSDSLPQNGGPNCSAPRDRACQGEDRPKAIFSLGPASGDAVPSNGSLPGIGVGPTHSGNESPEGRKTYSQIVTDTPSPRDPAFGTVQGTAPPEATHKSVEDDPSKGSDLDSTVQIPLIRFCGLTQSDSSLSSADGNTGYRYGTQTEYAPPDLSYFTAAECINGMNNPYHALHFLQHPGSFLFSPHKPLSNDTPSADSADSPRYSPSFQTNSASRMNCEDLVKQNPPVSGSGCGESDSFSGSPPPPAAQNCHSPSFTSDDGLKARPSWSRSSSDPQQSPLVESPSVTDVQSAPTDDLASLSHNTPSANSPSATHGQADNVVKEQERQHKQTDGNVQTAVSEGNVSTHGVDNNSMSADSQNVAVRDGGSPSPPSSVFPFSEQRPTPAQPGDHASLPNDFGEQTDDTTSCSQSPVQNDSSVLSQKHSEPYDHSTDRTDDLVQTDDVDEPTKLSVNEPMKNEHNDNRDHTDFGRDQTNDGRDQINDGRDQIDDGRNQTNEGPESPSFAPESTVVMKRLLSSDEERTTFL